MTKEASWGQDLNEVLRDELALLMQEGWELCSQARHRGRDEVSTFRAHQGGRLRASTGEEQETWPVSRMRLGREAVKNRWRVHEELESDGPCCGHTGR